jgi:hypothetical protein
MADTAILSPKIEYISIVIPAKAGIHILKGSEFMDSRLRGNDGFKLPVNQQPSHRQ